MLEPCAGQLPLNANQAAYPTAYLSPDAERSQKLRARSTCHLPIEAISDWDR